MRRHPRRPEFLERFAEQNGGGLSGTSSGILLLAAVDQSVEKSAGGDDDGCGGNAAAIAEKDAGDAVASCRCRWPVRGRCCASLLRRSVN